MNSAFFCLVIFYSAFISALLKVALKNFRKCCWYIVLMDSFIFRSVSSKLVEEFEGKIWTVSKKGQSSGLPGPSP